ncbi:MAG: LUD domain-containing protein [Bacteroidetes bacterium]|nr:LUD domain-containing protein [Fibrella sp.]
MSSRSQILTKVRANKPTLVPLPVLPPLNSVATDPLDQFADALAFVGGRLALLPPETSLADFVTRQYATAERIASSVPLAGMPTVGIGADTDKIVLEGVDLAVLRGDFAVAENAAVWVPEANMLHRALPFIAQHLLLVVDASQVLSTMHEAYRRLDRPTLSYGVFISGPSKTADIEQSLVIGAHGARSLTVVLCQQVSIIGC